jgi:serine/threonine protein kinase
MSAPVPTPNEHTLREFLLGNLPGELAEQVEDWLASHPSAANILERLRAEDALTRAVADGAPVEPVSAPTVEWVVRAVLQELMGGDISSPDVSNPTPVHPEESRPAALPLPAKLGAYRVVREIGRGGMGVVLEAEDDELQRRVAIKVMALERAQHPHAKARFLREARAAAAIEHENVVRIHHVGEDSGLPFIVMPLLRGESLDARLKREGLLPPAEVIRLGREVLAGLAAAHARGVVHRDVKPANIWLAAETGKVILLDFGVAKAADAADGLTAPGAIAGTPGFMAPELLDGHPADSRSDLFSLGATLYWCATGQRAFPGPTRTSVLMAVATHDPPPPHEVNPAVPVPLSDLIVRLLAKVPACRHLSAPQVLDDLAALSELVETPPPNPAMAADKRAELPLRVGASAGDQNAPIAATAETNHSPGVSDGQATLVQKDVATRTRRRLWTTLIAAAAALLLVGVGGWLVAHYLGYTRAAPPQYRGQVNVLVERTDQDGKVRLLRLNEAGALPMRKTDKFRIEGSVDPPAYLYVVWLDPEHDVTPVYPWDATKGWGSRPPREDPVGRVSLPRNLLKPRYIAPDAKPGVATIVLFARPTPLEVPDEEVRKWFEELPDLPLPAGGEQAAVWFDDYVEVRDPDRPRTFGEVGSDDAFARWQGQLQKVLGNKAAFQTAVSFARTGGK